MFASYVKTRVGRNQAAQKRDKNSLANLAPVADNPADMEAAVQACVAKHLSSSVFVNTLVDILAGRFEKYVVGVVQQSLHRSRLLGRVSGLEEKLVQAQVVKFKYDDSTNAKMISEYLRYQSHNVMIILIESIESGRCSMYYCSNNKPTIVKFVSYRDCHHVFSAK